MLYCAVLCCLALYSIVLYNFEVFPTFRKENAEPMFYTGINKLYFSYLGTIEKMLKKFPPMACECFLTTLGFVTVVHGFDLSN